LSAKLAPTSAKEVNLDNDNVALNYFHLKLYKTQNKTGGVINVIDSGGITRIVVFSFTAE
jgi:hypothetical protein